MWTGESLDTQDKGITKAATSAEKYFLMKTFVISTGDAKDDPDSQSHQAHWAEDTANQKRVVQAIEDADLTRDFVLVHLEEPKELRGFVETRTEP